LKTDKTYPPGIAEHIERLRTFRDDYLAEVAASCARISNPGIARGLRYDALLRLETVDRQLIQLELYAALTITMDQQEAKTLGLLSPPCPSA